MKRIKRGSGMTEVTETTLNLANPDDWQENERLFNNYSIAQRDANEGYEENQEGHRFRAATWGIRQTCQRIKDEEEKKFDPPETVEIEPDHPWKLATRILYNLDSADSAMERGDVGDAALYGFEAGRLWATAQMKWVWEAHAMRGVGTRRSSLKGGDMRRGKFADATPHILSRMKRLQRDGHSKSRAAELTKQAGYGTSKSANIKLWNRHYPTRKSGTES